MKHFCLETSDLVTDGKIIFFSNNKNQFFSIDFKSGSLIGNNKIKFKFKTNFN